MASPARRLMRTTMLCCYRNPQVRHQMLKGVNRIKKMAQDELMTQSLNPMIGKKNLAWEGTKVIGRTIGQGAKSTEGIAERATKRGGDALDTFSDYWKENLPGTKKFLKNAEKYGGDTFNQFDGGKDIKKHH